MSDKPKPNELQIGKFKSLVDKLSSPVVVKRFSATLGTWYPVTSGVPSDAKGCNHGPLIDRLNARIADLEGQVRVLTPVQTPGNVPGAPPIVKPVPASAYYGAAERFGSSRPAPKPSKKEKPKRWSNR